MNRDPGLWDEPPIWRVSVEIAKPHECNIAGIMLRCGGGCCKSKSYWPPTSGGNEDGSCAWLGPRGCTLAEVDKPVVCQLYPLLLHGDLIALHFRVRLKTSVCKGNHGNGPPLIDSMRSNLIGLFGEAQVDAVRADVMAGIQGKFYPSPDILAAVERERAWEAVNAVPEPRRGTVPAY